ncbi:restriction endonuclease subunit S [bacterium M00.F.Ca.ET.230.01.1.1]|nr:restriction endonuclease subunit S [Moraxella osloensis]TGP42551.1 restriction endonuclease subunit S [bacterium M00.F.Ca.ET.230.01.1.1]
MISKDIFNNTYPIKKLGEVVIFLDSKRKPVKESERVTGIYPYYGANGLQGWINDYIFDDELILLAEDGGHFNNPDRGVAYKITGKTWVNNHAHVIKPLEDLNIDYLCRVLENYDLRTWITGTTRAKLTKGGASEILIPLPPLTEQKRIAQILDKADELRQKRQQSIDKLDELLQACFLKIFENEKCSMSQIKDLLENEKSIRTGPFGSQLLHSEFVDEGIAVLGIDNAVKNTFKWAKPRFITPEKYEQLKRYTVKPKDVIITIMGTCGKCAVVPDKIPLSINTKHLCCITLDFDKCNPEFLHSYFLLHPTSINFLKSRAKGAIMAGLNMSIIKDLPVELPSIEIQNEFAELKTKIGLQKSKLINQLQEQDNLFQSLQQRAFNGEL